MIEHVHGIKGDKLNQIAQIWLDAHFYGSTISVVGNRFLSITDDSFFIYH